MIIGGSDKRRARNRPLPGAARCSTTVRPTLYVKKERKKRRAADPVSAWINTDMEGAKRERERNEHAEKGAVRREEGEERGEGEGEGRRRSAGGSAPEP